MSWWVIAYFLAYCSWTAWSMGFAIHHETEPDWFSILEGSCDACLLVVAAAFWQADLRASFAGVLLPLFSIGVTIFLCQVVAVARRQVPTRMARTLQARLFSGLSGVSTLIVLSAPMLTWGFMAVLDVSRPTSLVGQ